MKEGLIEEKYCIICYEPIGDSELMEIPPPWPVREQEG